MKINIASFKYLLVFLAGSILAWPIAFLFLLLPDSLLSFVRMLFEPAVIFVFVFSDAILSLFCWLTHQECMLGFHGISYPREERFLTAFGFAIAVGFIFLILYSLYLLICKKIRQQKI